MSFGARSGCLIAVTMLAGVAHAERPVLDGEATFGTPGGAILVHYATAGADAVPDPAFVEEVAAVAEAALAHVTALGFARPLDDTPRGGDGRIDIYLRDLQRADGNVTSDACLGTRCIGYAIAENDYAGYAYPSVGEGIRSVVPHELFHLVQNAYATGLPSTWTEGSAVWAVEHELGARNADFERFLPGFFAKTFRPIERAGAGFGDPYPYGAALWPVFLEQRFGVDVIVATWEHAATEPYVGALEAALAATHGATLADAFTEFTRWNWFTGSRAAGGGYRDAGSWPQVPLEPEDLSRVFVEGLSARYVPIALPEATRVELAGGPAAGFAIADGASLGDGIELPATLPAGRYTLVISGRAPLSIATPIEIVRSAPALPVAGPDEPGGCATGQASSLAVAALLTGLARARRARRARPAAGRARAA